MATSADSRSRFRVAVRNLESKEVSMNAFDSIVFSQQLRCIGTDGLGSCSVVLIVSPLAAILGHISPLPDNGESNDPYAGDNHVRDFMDRLTAYYVQCQSAGFFPQSSSWVVCAVFCNDVALPDQQKIMETKLRAVGLNVDTSKTYVVPYTADHPDRGSVFVDARGSTIKVYKENEKIQEIQKASTFTASKAEGNAPAESQWDGQYYVSTQNPAYVWINGAWAPRPSTITATSQSSGSAPAESQWDGQYYVSTQNPAYVWINDAWAPKPSTITATAQSLGSAPAESQWDGQYYVSTQNPAYVWFKGAWTIRP
jgi:hypothetical protein